MTKSGPENNRKVLARLVLCVSLFCIVVAALIFAVLRIQHVANRNLDRRQAESQQREFDRVKQGDSSALVMDSKLLSMLANDAECRQIVTSLIFASTNIDASDAKYVAELHKVTSMTFYCTRGTRELLLAARSLPIAEIYFEGPDLTDESYLILKDFPQLKKVQFEQIMEGEWIDRLKSELPHVIFEAPFPLSEEQGMAK